LADISGFAASEDSRKHKFEVGADSPLRSGAHGQEAHVTSVYLMQDWARGRARGWAQHRSEAWLPSPDAMRCSFLGNGLVDRAAILGVFKPVHVEGQPRRSLMLA